MKYFVIFAYLVFIIFCVEILGKTTKKPKFKRPVLIKKNKTQIIRKPIIPKEPNIFKTKNETTTYGQFGSTTVLHCHIIDNEANITVEWYKQGVEEPLSVGFTIPGTDKRFIVKQIEDTNHWMLRIKYSKDSDKGTYTCKVSGELKSTLTVYVKIKHAYAQIIGSNPRQLRIGYPLRLSCVLKASIEPPAYIFWYKDDRVINYELRDGANVREGRQGSELIFPRAERVDAGNYSCVPSNADQASVIVDVIKKVVTIDNLPEEDEP